MTDKHCSHCCKDITNGNSIYDWIVKLSDCPIPPSGAIVMDVLIYPQLGKDHYFCGLGCLKKWCENDPR